MKDDVANNDGNIQHSYDYFVVASSKITIKQTEKPNYKPDMNITSVCDLSGRNSETNKSKIYDFLDDKGILGATISDINISFPEALLEIKELINLNLIFRVGIVKTRFVTYKFSNPWLLHSFDIKRFHREKWNLGNTNTKVFTTFFFVAIFH